MPDDGSVSHWLAKAKHGEESAAARLWSRYGSRMRDFARGKLDRSSSLVDEDDVVICAFESFLRRAREGAYPHMSDRSELWRMLAAITLSKALQQRRNARRQKRGGGRAADSLDELNERVRDALRELSSPTPPPDLLASMNESLERLLDTLESSELQEIAIAKMHGYTNPEIAKQIDRSLPTVERRLRLIRHLWRKELAG